WFNRQLSDQRFLEPNSGLYWQVSGEGHEPYPSRSLWDRTLAVSGNAPRSEPLFYDSDQFPDEPLRVIEQTIRIPGSDVDWQLVVAAARGELDEQIRRLRAILVWSLDRKS